MPLTCMAKAGQTKGRRNPRPSVACFKSSLSGSNNRDREKQAAERDCADKAGQFLHVSFLQYAAQPLLDGRVVAYEGIRYVFVVTSK